MANGSLLIVARIEEIKLDHIGIIKDIFHIPKLCISLVSVQKLAKFLNLSIYFDGSLFSLTWYQNKGLDLL